MPQRLLIVDDSQDVHELVAVWLLDEGLELLSAYDAEQCMAIARAQAPDLILLDVDLPGKSGLEICRELKNCPGTTDIPVVFLSGATSTETRLQGLELGAMDFISKPFEPAELRARVRTSLRTRQLMNELEQKAAILRESEERFRVLAENSSDVIARLRPDGTILYISPACEPILGYRAADILGKSIYDFIHPDDQYALRACRQDTCGDKCTPTEYRFRRADGREAWLEATFRLIADSNGEVREIHSAARDVTTRKQSEMLEQDRTAVLELIARDCPPQEVVGVLIDAAERIHGGAASVILLEDGALTHTAPELPDDFADAIDRRLYRFAADFCSDAAAETQWIIRADLLGDSRWAFLRETAQRSGLHWCHASLIRSARDDVLGMFALYSAEPIATSPSTLAFFNMACKLIAVSAEHHQLNDRLAYQARHDGLTGLPNRSVFEDRLRGAINHAETTGRSVAVCYVDLDRFKQVNDTLGHHAGDVLLAQVVERFRESLRGVDVLARMGGDEFALILPELENAQSAIGIIRRLVESVRGPMEVTGHTLHCTISAGMAIYPNDGRDVVTLQKNADVALYHVKNAGRDGMCCFSPEMNSAALERLEIESALRAAIAREEIRLHYQPQVDQTGNIIAVEGLARWTDAELGVVTPGKFIPIAEDSGLIVPLGRAVVYQAIRQAKQWLDRGLGIRVAVNVSQAQFAQPNFADVVREALASASLDGRWLELELTESLIMRSTDDAMRKLAELKALGVSVAIDDFGTGYSSLAYLQQLHIDTIKADQSFISRITGSESAGSCAILRALAAMARELNVTLVAEGVETEAQRQFLHSIDCPIMQGYLFGKPQPPEIIEALLAKSPAAGRSARVA